MAWTLTYSPAGLPLQSRSLDGWGLCDVDFTTKGWACDTLTFRASGRAVDAGPIFPYKGALTLNDPAGVTQFVGIVTKLPVRGSSRAEDQLYTVSGPWWYFEKLVYQAVWQEIDSTGNGALISTIHPAAIVGLNSDGTRCNLGQMAATIFKFVLDTAAAAKPAFVPFTVGDVTPDLMIPLTDMDNVTCAQIMIEMFGFVPDATQWFNYATTPPTLHIGQRGNAGAVGIPCFVTGPVSGIDIEPRDDLVPPAVVVKYKQAINFDGEQITDFIPDIYPPDSPDPDFYNLVIGVALLPGSITFVKQNVVVTERPTLPTAEVANHWIKRKLAWLYGTTTQPTIYDTANIVWSDLKTTLDPADPYVTTPPTGFTLNTLVAELVQGAVTPWMTAQQNIFAASIWVAATLKYLGSDQATAALFLGQGNGVPGTRTDWIKIKATNAETQLYSAVASETPSEPVPVGIAKNLYLALSVVHYEGTIELSEPECGSMARIGLANVLNITGSANAAWGAMNAEIFEIVRSLDQGRTRIRIGPPAILDAQKQVALLRAARGRIQSFRADENQTGKADTGNVVNGHDHAPDNETHSPPGGGGLDTMPFAPQDKSAGAVPKAGFSVLGMVNGQVPDGAPVTVPVGTGVLYVQYDFTYDAVNNVTKVANALKSVLGTTSAVPASTCTPSGTGGGSGTFYWPIMTFTASVTTGVAKCVVARLVNGSINFGVCNGAILLPA